MPKTITWQRLMSIFVIGINHKTATVTQREQFYFAFDKLSLYLRDLLDRGLATEAVLLSTCNRSELYCEAETLVGIREWFCAQALDQSAHELLYVYQNQAAIAHIMQVACGLDSMVLGEPQILGQMKDAFAESCTVGAVSTSFHRLFQQIFNFAKDIRTSTAIGACPVSVASAAVHFAKAQVSDFTNANIVLIGAGDTNELIMRYLKDNTKPLTIVNRTMEKAKTLASATGGTVYGLDRVGCALSNADIVFSATGSAVPVIHQSMVNEVMTLRPNRRMVMIDIAVPRDIDPLVKDVEEVDLYCIDDLKAIIEQNRKGREHAAEKAREMVQVKSKEYLRELQSYDRVSHTIRAYRSQIEDICRNELIKAKQQLYVGVDPALVLDTFAAAFVKKLLHTPSVQLRQAGAEGKFELLQLAKQLFAIPDPEIEHL